MATRGPQGESRKEILRTAARLFQERGYDATSMQDIATSLNFSKAALYHHFESKEEILVQIMNYGLDAVEQQVMQPVASIADPEERLRACIERHVTMVTSGNDREVIVVLHENRTLPREAGRQINARKKQYVAFLTQLIQQVQAKRGLRTLHVQPQVAAFALLGMINWMYQWYKPGHEAEGGFGGPEITREYTALLFQGAFAGR